ncbi:MAG: hypothetical protein ROO76_04710 [Terriglobia bacterium]|nr:hypothetical protein [Terriglobia bacterium]
MKKLTIVALCILLFAGLAVAQTYTSGTGIVGVDKLGAHQNGGRGCVGCHAPHSGARGNGGNAAATGGAVTDPNTGDLALWGEDLGPLYTKTFNFGAEGAYDITLPGSMLTTDPEQEAVITGVMMCLSCHDGNIAKGAMMTNQSYEQSTGLLPATYGSLPIPTLLGADGTAAGNYNNDHPIGPKATLGAVGVASHLTLFAASTGTCSSHGTNVDCLQPKDGDTAFLAFYAHYGAFNITQSTTKYPSGGRTTGVVIPTGAADATTAYLVCTTCHTPHSMYPFSGTAAGVKGTYPTYFFITAPYNPGAPVTNPTTASSATQFCRQCHFTGAGGSNEGSGIMTVTTQF